MTNAMNTVMTAAATLIASFHTAGVTFYTDAATGEEMVIINDTTPGATDYTLPMMEAAKRIMEYKRMMNRIRKARAEKVAA